MYIQVYMLQNQHKGWFMLCRINKKNSTTQTTVKPSSKIHPKSFFRKRKNRMKYKQHKK